MLGGALGAALRYAMVLKFPKEHSILSSPILWANGLGCLCFAIGMVWLKNAPNEMFRLFFMVGAMGALTTFSSYIFEVVNFNESQGLMQAGLALFAHLILGFVAIMLGLALGRMVF